jgi:hypothetical protein
VNIPICLGARPLRGKALLEFQALADTTKKAPGISGGFVETIGFLFLQDAKHSAQWLGRSPEELIANGEGA